MFTSTLYVSYPVSSDILIGTGDQDDGAFANTATNYAYNIPIQIGGIQIKDVWCNRWYTCILDVHDQVHYTGRMRGKETKTSF